MSMKKCSVCKLDTGSLLECKECGVLTHRECYFMENENLQQSHFTCKPCARNVAYPKCVACPHFNGLFLTTERGKWIHVICATIVPGLIIDKNNDHVVCGMDVVDKQMWNVVCMFCKKSNVGACLTCSKLGCQNAYHVTCGRENNVILEKTTMNMVSYCSEKHAIKDQHRIQQRKLSKLQLQKEMDSIVGSGVLRPVANFGEISDDNLALVVHAFPVGLELREENDKLVISTVTDNENHSMQFAAKSKWIQVGDQVVAVGFQAVTTIDEFQHAMQEAKLPFLLWIRNGSAECSSMTSTPNRKRLRTLTNSIGWSVPEMKRPVRKPEGPKSKMRKENDLSVMIPTSTQPRATEKWPNCIVSSDPKLQLPDFWRSIQVFYKPITNQLLDNLERLSLPYLQGRVLAMCEIGPLPAAMHHIRAETICNEYKGKLFVGDTVSVKERTGVGMNKPGGIGRITKIQNDNGQTVYNVRYVLGGSERKIPRKFLQPADLGFTNVSGSTSAYAQRLKILEMDIEDGDPSYDLNCVFLASVRNPATKYWHKSTITDSFKLQFICNNEGGCNSTKPILPNNFDYGDNFLWKIEEFSTKFNRTKIEFGPTSSDMIGEDVEILIGRHNELSNKLLKMLKDLLVKAKAAQFSEANTKKSTLDDIQFLPPKPVPTATTIASKATISHGKSTTTPTTVDGEGICSTTTLVAKSTSKAAKLNVIQTLTVDSPQSVDKIVSSSANILDEALGNDTGDDQEDVSSEEDETLPKLSFRGECALCNIPGDGLVKTSCGRFAHPMCALYTPETYFENHVACGLQNIPPGRYSLKCNICKSARGCNKVQCQYKRCTLAYHVHCAHDHRLLTNKDDIFEAWCPAHLKKFKMEKHVDVLLSD